MKNQVLKTTLKLITAVLLITIITVVIYIAYLVLSQNKTTYASTPNEETYEVVENNEIDINKIKELLSNSPSIIVQDDIKNGIYPLAINSTGTDEVYIGRIRRDYSVKSGINMWVVADNIRKGAATNAIQILEKLI